MARTATADRVAKSVCPYCAVGCAQNVYVKDEKVVQIEGNPDSPINRGRLCPKGSASKQLVTSPTRVTKVRYRRPYGTEWEDLDLDTAMEMIADRVLDARRKTWQDTEELDGLFSGYDPEKRHYDQETWQYEPVEESRDGVNEDQPGAAQAQEQGSQQESVKDAGRAEQGHREHRGANSHRGPRRPERLPLLRRRLRAEGLRQGREGHPDRG